MIPAEEALLAYQRGSEGHGERTGNALLFFSQLGEVEKPSDVKRSGRKVSDCHGYRETSTELEQLDTPTLSQAPAQFTEMKPSRKGRWLRPQALGSRPSFCFSLCKCQPPKPAMGN